MSDSGFIYVLQNPAFEGLLKIGKTARDVRIRSEELASTGVPFAFNIIYAQFVSSGLSGAEMRIHDHLQEFRVAKNREFFAVDPEVAIIAIFDHCVEYDVCALDPSGCLDPVDTAFFTAKAGEEFIPPDIFNLLNTITDGEWAIFVDRLREWLKERRERLEKDRLEKAERFT
jgi:hypothetical protein